MVRELLTPPMHYSLWSERNFGTYRTGGDRVNGMGKEPIFGRKKTREFLIIRKLGGNRLEIESGHRGGWEFKKNKPWFLRKRNSSLYS